MAVSLDLVGSGTIGEILPGWSVQEDATPITLGDSSGSVGSVNLSSAQGEDSEFIIDNGSNFIVDNLGSIAGKISNVVSSGLDENTDTTLSITATTPLAQFPTNRVMNPIVVGSYGWTWPNNEVPTISGSTMAPIWGLVETDDGYYGSNSADQIGFTLPPFAIGFYDKSGVNQFTFGTTGGSANGQFGVIATSLAVDSKGYVYAVDPSNNRIQKFTPAGVYVTQWGSAGSTPGKFAFNGQQISCITIDSGDNVYVTDTNNFRVQKFVPGATDSDPHVYSTMWGTQGTGDSNFGIGFFNIFAVGNHILVNDVYTNKYVKVFDLNGSFVTKYATPSLTLAGPMQPSMAVSNDNGHSYIYILAGTILYFTIFDPTLPPAPFSPRQISIPNISNPGFINTLATSSGEVLATFGSWGTLSLSGVNMKLSAAIRAYLNSTQPGTPYSYEAEDDPYVLIPGWTGDVWDHLKQLCTVYNIEIASINGTVTVRGTNISSLDITNSISGTASLTLDTAATGLFVDINYYEIPESNTESLNGELGKKFYDASDTGQIFQIDVGQKTTVTVQTVNYPNTVIDPVVTDFNPLFPVLDGEYCVIASDNLPVTASEWTAFHGQVQAAVSPTIPGAIDITFTGPSTAIPGVVGPFSFAVSDGDSTFPAFSILGNGLLVNPNSLHLATGADPAKTSVQIASTIDNIFVNSLERAYSRGMWASAAAAGPTVSLRFSIPTADIEGFGLSSGKIVKFKEALYRISSMQIGNDITQITATRNTMVSDFDTFHNGETVGGFDTFWSGNQVEDVSIKPLRPIV